MVWGQKKMHLSVLVEVQLQRLDVLLKAQRAHRPDEVVTIDGFPLFTLAFVAGPASIRMDQHQAQL